MVGEHRLSGGVVDDLAAHQHLLAALGNDADAQAIDAMQRLGGRAATVQRKTGNSRHVVAIASGNPLDGPGQSCRVGQ
jgi:hypothetical protein